MKTILEILIYCAKCFYDPKGLAEAMNAAETVEELDEMVLGKKTEAPSTYVNRAAAE